MSILYIEPYYGGSHKQMIDLLQKEFGGVVYSLPDTKWHWRMRTCALHFADVIPQKPHPQYKVLFASGVLNLCELLGLRSDLKSLHKILYFHENQLIYPVRKQQERDFQFGYIQILSCNLYYSLVADQIIFNSHFNMNSFLAKIDPFLNSSPSPHPRDLVAQITPKCQVLHYPISIPRNYIFTTTFSHMKTMTDELALKESVTLCKEEDNDIQLLSEKSHEQCSASYMRDSCTHILWPHRWEHDKGPDVFAQLIKKLLSFQPELHFQVSILGTHTGDIPICFQELFECLGKRLINCGTVDKDQYWTILNSADIVISTAKHEFFGVAMIEATCCGAFPLCPNDLVYPEIFPEQCLYNTDQQLFKKVKNLCQRPHLAKVYRKEMSAAGFCQDVFQWDTSLKTKYKTLLCCSCII